MFFPVGDDNTRRLTTPFVVWLIFGLNAFVWILQLGLREQFTYAFAATPYEIVNNIDLDGPLLLRINGQSLPLNHSQGPSPIQLTLFSAMFMHGSWAHIIGNMVYLLIFADQIEDSLGHLRFLLFYVICGLAAGLAHVVFAPASMIPSLGASGAIAGVLGAYLVAHPTNTVRVMYWHQIIHVPAFIVLGGWIFLQMISQISAVGVETGVAYMAHIGGFMAGVPLYFIMRRRQRGVYAR
ncbi:MAG: rhomboid family intramembrane serine protease [Deltaproteobacteria bacterium]|nr:rhomboid family intramembrane serine protease [Deltaproteobacteria bacterium]